MLERPWQVDEVWVVGYSVEALWIVWVIPRNFNPKNGIPEVPGRLKMAIKTY